MTFLSPKAFTLYLATLPPEVLLVFIFVSCITGLLVMTRLFGLIGMFGYSLLAIIISNIQVLKATHFSFLSEPVALGTVVFSTTFLITDIITEYYSSQKAMKLVWLGFVTMILMSLVMIFTIGIVPLDPTTINPEHNRFFEAHRAMEVLFLPAPAIFLASLISYLLSQINDVWLFNLLKKLCRKRFLWLRSGLSTALSSLMDSAIFSTLAWVVFTDSPIDWKTLLWTYILGTYALRLVMTVVNIPVVYAAKKFIPKQEAHV